MLVSSGSVSIARLHSSQTFRHRNQEGNGPLERQVNRPLSVRDSDLKDLYELSCALMLCCLINLSLPQVQLANLLSFK